MALESHAPTLSYDLFYLPIGLSYLRFISE